MVRRRSTGKRRGVLVIGGAVIYRRGDRWHSQQRILAYLGHLERDLGPVSFHAARGAVGDGPIAVPPVPASIHVTALAHTPRSLPTAFALSIVTAVRLFVDARAASVVIHFFPDAGGVPGRLALRISRRPVITYFKSDWVTWSRDRHPGLAGALRARWWRFAERLEHRWSDVLLVRDARQLEDFRRRTSARVERAAPMWALTEVPQRVQRRDSGQPVVLYVGALSRTKGLDDLIAATGRLRDIHQFRIVVAGSPPGEVGAGTHVPDWLAQCIAATGTGDRITFTGYVDDPATLARLYHDADLFVLPSRFEGFPRVIDEAMSFGLPIITTDLPGVRRALEEGEALFVPPGSVDELTQALSEVLASPELRQELGTAARRAFERRVPETASQQHVRLARSYTSGT